MSKIQRFITEKRGATSVEYCFLAALIIVACVGGIALFGGGTAGMFGDSNDQLTSAFDNR